MDMTKTIEAKSDQLNADDLTGGPITAKIEAVSKGQSDQPVVVKISGGHMPFRPCKTALRILAAAWGTDTTAWIGRWVTLYRDPTVMWAGVEVGGIRIQSLSHIERPLTLNLATTRGKKKAHRIDILNPAESKQSGAPTADLDALLADNELVRADVDKWRESIGKPTLAEMNEETISQLAAWLASNPAHMQAIKALAGDDSP